MSKRAVAVSPHLDDAVFSCGATLAGLAAAGWEVTLVTAFTASVPDPRGFALAWQTDRGVPTDADYMALRRAEDERAAELLGIARTIHLPLPEAPHRGYESASELFAGVRSDDDAPARLAGALGPVLDGLAPDRMLAPLALGEHVDHLVLNAALTWLAHPAPAIRWRDVPYALREPSPGRPANETAVPVAALLERKLDACAAYATQLGFQFGGEHEMRTALTRFAEEEGSRHGLDGPAEAIVEPPPDPRRDRLAREEAERSERAAIAKLAAQIRRG